MFRRALLGSDTLKRASHEKKNPYDGVHIFILVPGLAEYYIGFNDRHREGHFVWENTGRPGYYTKWRDQEPNNLEVENCALIVTATWNDLDCSATRRYICEL